MTLEKELADKVVYSIYLKDIENTEKFYKEYIHYIKNILKNGDVKLREKITLKYKNFMEEQNKKNLSTEIGPWTE